MTRFNLILVVLLLTSCHNIDRLINGRDKQEVSHDPPITEPSCDFDCDAVLADCLAYKECTIKEAKCKDVIDFVPISCGWGR